MSGPHAVKRSVSGSSRQLTALDHHSGQIPIDLANLVALGTSALVWVVVCWKSRILSQSVMLSAGKAIVCLLQ
jgi:hypothetical protein